MRPRPEPPRKNRPPLAAPAEGDKGHIIPVSEGIAIGPFFRYQAAIPPIPQESAQDPAAEWTRLEQAIEKTRLAISQRKRRLGGTISENEAAIFDAHGLILQDPELLSQVRERIQNGHQNAAFAWNAVLSADAQAFRALEDSYLQERAVDVEDVRDQVLLALAGKSASVNLPETPVILYAEDLTPSETSQMDLQRVLAIITAGGGPTSHSAILARALGIPAIAGARAQMEHVRPGDLLAVDGTNGMLWVDPPDNVREELSQRREAWLAARAGTGAHQPCPGGD